MLGVGKYRKVLAAKEDPSADHGPLLKKNKMQRCKVYRDLAKSVFSGDTWITLVQKQRFLS